MRELPDGLVSKPFTREEALRAGLSPEVLRGRRVRRLFRGVYIGADAPLTRTTWLTAALLVLPADAVVSHVTALSLWGFGRGGGEVLEFSTNHQLVTRHARIRLHRRRGRLTPYVRDGLPVTGPDRTFVDCALRLRLVTLVQLAEHLINSGATTRDVLVTYCHARHIDGVQRARRVVRLVMSGVESPMETAVRLMLVFARLPCPEVNPEIFDGSRFVARVDMLYRKYNVIVEYDGWQHERDARQRQRDRERREDLERLGYRLIVVTSEDLRRPAAIPWRVYEALRQRGYEGGAPTTSVVWQSWFRSEM